MNRVVLLWLLTLLFCSFAVAQNSPAGAVLPENKEKACKSGVVRLRVELLANGKVGNITPICELPYGLTEQAVKAAKKIKFVPEKRNGVAITLTKTVEYTFTLDETDLPSTKVYQSNEKAEAVVQKAIQRLGGERYLAVKTATGRGNFTAMKENEASLPSTFSDYIVYPDKERTEFKTGGVKTIQTNVGDGGWFADTGARVLKDQTPEQVADFKFSIRTGLDSFLRGNWRNEKDAKLEYVGRREASLGKRNEVVKLTYADGLAIEFEFAAQDGTPAKVSYNRPNVGAEESKEEDRFAQFVEVGGVFVPYIIDHYRNGKQTSRVNYESIRFNDPVPDALFIKPKDIKKLK